MVERNLSLSDSTPSRPAANSALTPEPLRAVLLIDATGQVTHASKAAATLWGTFSDALVGTSLADLLADPTPESNDIEIGSTAWLDALSSAASPVRRLHLRRSDSLPDATASSEVNVSIEPLAPDLYLATVDQIRVAPGHSLSHEQLLPLHQQGAVGFYELNVASGAASFSSTWKNTLGYQDAELPDTIAAWRALIHPDDSNAALDQAPRQASAGARPFAVEFRLRHRTGRWVWVQSTGLQILGERGEVVRVVGIQIDISDRKEAEEAVLASDERFELLCQTGPLGAFDLDFTQQNFWFSSTWKNLLGLGAEPDGRGLSLFLNALPPEEKSVGVEAWIRLRAPGQVCSVTAETLQAADGRQVPVFLGLHRTFTRKKELARVVGFICAAPVADAGSFAPALVHDALTALAEGLVLTDAAGKIIFANASAARLLGRPVEELRGETSPNLLQLVERDSGQSSPDPFTRAIASDEPLPLITDTALAARDSTQTPTPIEWTARTSRDASGRLQGVAILFPEVRELSPSSDDLLRINRLESLATVAGGIAHDLNDLLTTILGGISLAKDHHNLSGLADSESAGASAKGLTKQLLVAAKGEPSAPVVIEAEEILKASIKLASAGSDVAISITVEEGAEPVRVDRLQITQVFQNLILNARQAMLPPPHEGRIQLRAANITLEADQIPPLAPGNYVEFEVRDNGNGIAAENLQKIFDPYFTTRKHGTGLGLPTAVSIVRKHGGQIGVVSTPGEGSAFTVFLPSVHAAAAPVAQKAPSARFRTGRILIMDDDPRVTSLTASMLQTLEYKFDVARHGAEAIQLYQRYLNINRPYDAVVLDVTVVGGMGGEECFRALRDLDPGVRAIISTGYENDAMGQRFLDLGFCGCLTKPYRIADLGKVLKTVVG